MKYPCIAILLLYIGVSAYAMPKSPIGADFVKKSGMFEKMDQHALNTPDWAEKDIETLVKYLIEPAKTELDKTRVIWRWITANISYGKNFHWKKTFTERLGVCNGYSTLYTRMGKLAGLEIYTITGWSKGYTRLAGTFSKGEMHAWNAVKIDDKWYLLDSTWGAGRIYMGEFQRRYNEFWFLTKPSEFIFTHYPEMNRWQILKKPVPLSQYIEWPNVTSFFFENNMRPLSHYIAVHPAKKTETVKIRVPKDINVKAYLLRYDKKGKHSPTVSRQGTTVTIRPRFQLGGAYNLMIFGKKKTDKEYQFAIQYIFNSKGEQTELEINHTGKETIKVESPKVKLIPANKQLKFLYISYYGENMRIVNAGKTILLTGNGRFEKYMSVKPGAVEVYVKNYGEDIYRPVCVYTAE